MVCSQNCQVTSSTKVSSEGRKNAETEKFGNVGVELLNAYLKNVLLVHLQDAFDDCDSVSASGHCHSGRF